ncbi:MAG: peptidoglycan-binding protein [Myxococcales bacterium]|nr:peptidoglycan-binding protein [Myxococcales bacterium]MBL0193403.1 peptidoglycan-binding protein [Myxococcales bacterium]HQY62932.1 peptidoglycan-binding domain-containing protein [Polyangiaceae bacterium]
MSSIHQSEKYGTIDLESVAGLQTALVLLDVDSGEVDGILGPKTREAIKAFQAMAGLTADGVSGPQTRAALDAALTQLAETGL